VRSVSLTSILGRLEKRADSDAGTMRSTGEARPPWTGRDARVEVRVIVISDGK
jgi:hypothetical protein